MMQGLDETERKTYGRHRSAQAFESLFLAICWSGADVAIKSFDATVLIVTLITMAPGVAMLVALFVARRLQVLGRKRLLHACALVGRAPLLLVIFIAGPWSFLALLSLQALTMSVVVANWNSLIRVNYRDKHRAHLFAHVTRLGALVSGIGTLGAGIWLDMDQTAYRYIYPIAAILGILSLWIFAGIDARRSEHADDDPDAEAPRFRELMRRFFGDRDFLQYEIGFMLYGVAFMAISTAKPLRMAGVLDLPYATLLGSKAAFSLAMVLASVVVGISINRLGPARLAARAYWGLALYCGMLLMTTESWHLVCAEAYFGLVMTAVHIAWNLGPVLLAPNARVASSYMLIHVALVGVRSAIGHPIGGVLTEVTGDPRTVFVFSSVFFVLAALTMANLARRRERSGTARAVGERAEEAEVPGEASPRPTPTAPD
jgi:predicted MFS family arabinose efflux permease